MRLPERVLFFVFFVAIFCFDVAAQKQAAKSPKILSAKSVCFENTTGSEKVGENALAALKKWGRYRIVSDPKQADLIFLLSADPYKGGNLVFANGQTGSIDDQGDIEKDPKPDFNKLSPTRYAYLTVIECQTGYALWTDSHAWGGLLTGFNSVGARLVKKLESETKR